MICATSRVSRSRIDHAVEALADAVVEESSPEVREDLVAHLIELVRTSERAGREDETPRTRRAS